MKVAIVKSMNLVIWACHINLNCYKSKQGKWEQNSKTRFKTNAPTQVWLHKSGTDDLKYNNGITYTNENIF